jgi:outer membrane scaffolding protein for murein synthesis (MipA/OmpV family)
MRLRVIPVLSSCATLAFCTIPHAVQAQAWPTESVMGGWPPGGMDASTGWSGQLAIGLARAPHFTGSRTSRTGPLLGLNAAYTTRSAGTWRLGSGGLGWSRRLGDVQVGVALGADTGRRDHGEGRQPLNGLGDVDATPVVTLFAATQLGPVPVLASMSRATRSHHGMQLNLALPLRFALNDALALHVTPALNWADGRTMQAYHGISAAQAARTAYPAFDAEGGWRSVGLSVGLDYRLGGQWHLVGGSSVQRLAGDAGRSPLTKRRQQVRSMLALAYQF